MTVIAFQNLPPRVITIAQQQMISRLERELVAPCCYTQPVADHMSGEAENMRDEIQQMVLLGRSEQQILEAYKARYGEIILATPDGLTGTIAYTVPPVVGLIACCFVFVLLLRWKPKRGNGGSAALLAAPVVARYNRFLDRIRMEVEDW